MIGLPERGNKMTTWNEMKTHLNSIKPAEMTAIESLAFLHAQRVKAGISQIDFAKRIGMRQPQLAKIESMTSVPSLSTLNRYAKGLGLVATLSFKPRTKA